MNAFLQGLLRDSHGQYDEQALISLAAAMVFFALEIYSVVLHGARFDPLEYGAAVGTLMGATSAGFGLRAHLTPPPGIDPTGAPQ